MFYHVSHRLFLIATLLVVNFQSMNAQELPIVQLPCSSPSPSDSFCMGSLGNVSALHGSGKPLFRDDLISTSAPLTGCMSAKNCEIVLIGQHSIHNGTIQWQLLNNIPFEQKFEIWFYLSPNKKPKVKPGTFRKFIKFILNRLLMIFLPLS